MNTLPRYDRLQVAPAALPAVGVPTSVDPNAFGVGLAQEALEIGIDAKRRSDKAQAQNFTTFMRRTASEAENGTEENPGLAMLDSGLLDPSGEPGVAHGDSVFNAWRQDVDDAWNKLTPDQQDLARGQRNYITEGFQTRHERRMGKARIQFQDASYRAAIRTLGDQMIEHRDLSTLPELDDELDAMEFDLGGAYPPGLFEQVREQEYDRIISGLAVGYAADGDYKAALGLLDEFQHELSTEAYTKQKAQLQDGAMLSAGMDFINTEVAELESHGGQIPVRQERALLDELRKLAPGPENVELRKALEGHLDHVLSDHRDRYKREQAEVVEVLDNALTLAGGDETIALELAIVSGAWDQADASTRKQAREIAATQRGEVSEAIYSQNIAAAWELLEHDPEEALWLSTSYWRQTLGPDGGDFLEAREDVRTGKSRGVTQTNAAMLEQRVKEIWSDGKAAVTGEGNLEEANAFRRAVKAANEGFVGEKFHALLDAQSAVVEAEKMWQLGLGEDVRFYETAPEFFDVENIPDEEYARIRRNLSRRGVFKDLPKDFDRDPLILAEWHRLTGIGQEAPSFRVPPFAAGAWGPMTSTEQWWQEWYRSRYAPPPPPDPLAVDYGGLGSGGR